MFHTFVPNTTTKIKCTLSTGLQETPLIWFEAPVAPVVTLVLECVEEVLVNVSSPWAYTLRESSSVQSHAWWTGKKALRKDGRKSLWHILHFRQTTMRAYVLFVFLRARPRSFRKMKERKESSPSEKVFPVQFFVSSG